MYQAFVPCFLSTRLATHRRMAPRSPRWEGCMAEDTKKPVSLRQTGSTEYGIARSPGPDPESFHNKYNDVILRDRRVLRFLSERPSTPEDAHTATSHTTTVATDPTWTACRTLFGSAGAVTPNDRHLELDPTRASAGCPPHTGHTLTRTDGSLGGLAQKWRGIDGGSCGGRRPSPGNPGTCRTLGYLPGRMDKLTQSPCWRKWAPTVAMRSATLASIDPKTHLRRPPVRDTLGDVEGTLANDGWSAPWRARPFHRW